jgi:malate dehydrogenase (oxaloacetate-decarboxylating)(NADP+)
MDSGVARKLIVDMDAYVNQLGGRLNPTAASLQGILAHVRREPKRVVFAEGEEEQVIRAANTFASAKLGHAILVGRSDQIHDAARAGGLDSRDDVTIMNARESDRNRDYAEFLYKRLQRKGFLFRDCQRLVNNDRNIFAACMVAMGDADAMVTGVTRNYSVALEDVLKVIDPKPGHTAIGISMALCRTRTVFVADTAIHDMPTAEELASIAVEAAGVARRLGHEPRVAMLAFSTFGHPEGERSDRVREAVQILDGRKVDFEYDGEMAADVALNPDAAALYPFCRLKGPANVLVMPAFHSASISTKMLQELGGATVVGPLLVGLNKPVQIATLGATASDLVNMAAIAAYNLNG